MNPFANPFTRAGLLWEWAGGAVLFAGLALLVWALWWSRFRGFRSGAARRKLCPKCWYDMTGLAGRGDAARATPGATCPECGTITTDERRFYTSPKRWGFALLACLVMLVGWAGHRLPDIRVRGWRAGVPTWAIACFWPMDFRAVVGSLTEPAVEDAMIEEFTARLTDPTAHGISARMFVRRLLTAKTTKTLGSAQTPETDRVLAAVDCGHFVDTYGPGRPADDFRGSCITGGDSAEALAARFAQPTLGDWTRDRIVDFLDTASSTVYRDDWWLNGGDEINARSVGTTILIHGPEPKVRLAATMLGALQAALESVRTRTETVAPALLVTTEQGEVRCYDVRAVVRGLRSATQPPTLDEANRGLHEEIQRVMDHLMLIAPESWLLNAGDSAVTRTIKDVPVVVILQSPEMHALIARELSAMEGTRWWEVHAPENTDPAQVEKPHRPR